MQNQAKVIVLRSRFETIKFHVFGVDFHDSMFTTLCIVMVFNSRVLAPLRSPLLRRLPLPFRLLPAVWRREAGTSSSPAPVQLESSSSIRVYRYYVRLVTRTLVINIGHEYFRIDSLHFHKITSKINRPRPD